MSQSGRPLNQVKLQVQTQVARLQSICEQHGDISIEAVYLLAWTILLQKYRAKEHDLFAWRCHRGFQFNHWQQAIDPGRDVLASLREASKGYQARKSYSTDGSVADTAVHFHHGGFDGELLTLEVCRLLPNARQTRADLFPAEPRTSRRRTARCSLCKRR
jgi:hypothetical protein